VADTMIEAYQVMGIDAWEDDFAGIAVQFSGDLADGWFPKLVLAHKTTFQQHFEDVLSKPRGGSHPAIFIFL
jgi:hypothetical protein